MTIILNPTSNYNLLASLSKKIGSNGEKYSIRNLLYIQIGEDHDRSEEKPFSNDERDKLVSHISESIQNLSQQINGKGK